VPAGDAKPPQCALDGVVDHRLDIATTPLDLADEVSRYVEGLAYVIEQRLATVVERVRRSALFLREHDLREDDLRQVLAAVAIDDLDRVAVANQVGDAFERYVVTRLRVVELAIRVLLDKVSFRGYSHF